METEGGIDTKAEKKRSRNWKYLDGTICNDSSIDESISGWDGISDTCAEELEQERRAYGVTNFDDPVKPSVMQNVYSLLHDQSGLIDYLKNFVDGIERRKIFDALPKDISIKVKQLFEQTMREHKSFKMNINSAQPRQRFLDMYQEYKEWFERLGYPTHRLERYYLVMNKYNTKRNPHIDAYPEDLSYHLKDSPATIEYKKKKRAEIARQGLLKEALDVDLKEIHKEKMKKQVGASTDKDLRLRLKARKATWRAIRNTLVSGQRGTADRMIPSKRPRHLYTGKSKPWKKTRGRGYKGPH
ncbi:hypothetical protein AAMO2058_001117400 [Amorphochlora amoebiformis]